MFKDRTHEFLACVSAAQQRGVRATHHRSIAVRGVEHTSRQSAYAMLQRALAGKHSVLPLEQLVTVAVHATRRAQDSALLAGNEQQHLHFCVLEQMLLAHTPKQQPETRAAALTGVARRLQVVSSLYDTVCAMIEQHGHTLDILERNVTRIQLRVDASESELADAAPRTFRTRRRQWVQRIPCLPRSLPARLRCCVALLVFANLVLFWYGYL